MILSVCYPASPSLPAFPQDFTPENLWSPNSLFKAILEYYEDKVLPTQKYINFWKTLAVSYCGISIEHLSKILDLRKPRIDSFLNIFGFAVIKGPEDCWRLNGFELQEVVYELYLNNEEKILKQHQMIGLSLLREKKISPFLVFCITCLLI